MQSAIRGHLRSFRRTIVVLVWASVTLPVVILSSYQLRDDYEQQLSRNSRELELQAERAALVISQELREMMADLDRIASDGSVIRSISMPILSPVSVKSLQQFLGAHTSASTVMLIDEELFPVEVLPSWALTEDLGEYQAFLADTVTAESSVVDPRARIFVPEKQPADDVNVAFVRPILGASESLTKPFEVRGLLFTKVSLPRLIRDLNLVPGPQQALTLVHDKRSLLAMSNVDGTSSEFNFRSEISLGHGDDVLAVELSRSSQGAFMKVLRAYRTQGAVALFFIVVVFLGVRWVAERLTRPLRMLSEITASMSARNFETDDTISDIVESDDVHYQEFDEAFHLLKDMEATIAKQFKQLHDANVNLEHKVAERTYELERNIVLLDRKKEFLRSLVQFSLEVQQMESLDDVCHMATALAFRIAGSRIGIDIRRSENFSGYQNFQGLDVDSRHYLGDHAAELREFSSLLRVSKNSPWLQFVTIGSSTPSFQGYLVLEKGEDTEEAVEILQVLCTMLSSAFRQYNLTEKLHRLAHTDSLTGIANRHYMSTRLNDRIQHYDPTNPDTHFGVFVVDVNGLKRINDHYGHEFGDQMLNTVAQGLKRIARERDTVARVGGDEFYLLLERADAKACENFSLRLQDLCHSLHMSINGEEHPITFSFGFATTQNDPVKDMLKLADMRMYAVKQSHYQKVPR